MWTFYTSNDCSTIKDVYFLCQSWMTLTHTHVTRKFQVICEYAGYQTTAILSQTFFVWFTVALESYSTRHVSVVLCYNFVCIYCKATYTSVFTTQLGLTTKLTYLMTACYTPNNGFTAKDAPFYKNKVGQLHYTLQSLSINCLCFY